MANVWRILSNLPLKRRNLPLSRRINVVTSDANSPSSLANGIVPAIAKDGNGLTQTRGVVSSQSHGSVVRSEHDLHEHERESVLGRPGGGREGNGNVGNVFRVELDTGMEHKG